MYRIGILGSENSHASAFSEIFNKPDENGVFKYPDCHVVAVGGHYPESNQEVFEKYGLDFIAEKPEDMLGKVDAVMVTARDGKFHPEFARPFVEAGLPLFIDKPFAVDRDEALALAKLAKSKHVPLVGGSSVKQTYDIRMMQHTVKSGLGGIHGGCVAAPVSMHNDYSGFFFYSSHLAEMSLTIFGYDPKAVTAFRNGDDVTVVVEYDKYDVTNHFMLLPPSGFLLHNEGTKDAVRDFVNTVKLCREFRRAGETEHDIVTFDFLVDRVRKSTLAPIINVVHCRAGFDHRLELFDNCSSSLIAVLDGNDQNTFVSIFHFGH